MNYSLPWSAPSSCRIDAVSGRMSGNTGGKKSLIRDLDGVYADGAAFSRLAAERGDDTAYAVDEFRPASAASHDLIFGTSILEPGRVGTEFFLTRGHIHVKSDRPEVYFCQNGRGVMHMELPSGETRPAAMAPGTVVYVPPYWIHRSVNTGDTPFVTFFCYPADAGQDYAIIARSGGMRTIIVDNGSGGWREAENPRYRPRPDGEQRRYFGVDR